MDKNKSQQRKKIVLNYVYATLIGLLVIACALSIAFITNRNTKTSREPINVGPGDDITVSTTTYVMPMNNATIAKDYSGKELQYNNTLKQWQIHKAIDFIGNENLNVMAIANGKVTNVYTNYLEGTVVEISHADGIVSIYKSLASDVKVSVGETVTAGQVIGTASESMAEELNTGAHLHLEMTVNGVKVDPNNYLSLGDK